MLDPAFAELLPPAHLAELKLNPHTVIGLRRDNTIAFRNLAWRRFASENGAPDLADWSGGSILDVFRPSVREAYDVLFDRVREQAEPADHVYQCSSPTTYREFCLRVLPLADGHLLLIHHLVVDQVHSWPSEEPGHRYVDVNGIISQCCHCRRTNRAEEADTWDWVPAYLDHSVPNISHGLCPPCFRHYYPEVAALQD